MRRRTQAREEALKILYRIDIAGDDVEDVLNEFSAESKLGEPVREFCVRLVRGTRSKLKNLDKVIASSAENWQIERMAKIDRNIIRMSAFELLFCEDIPAKVSINEAVELAKRYGDINSGKFVNGVLDKVNRSKDIE